ISRGAGWHHRDGGGASWRRALQGQGLRRGGTVHQSRAGTLAGLVPSAPAGRYVRRAYHRSGAALRPVRLGVVPGRPAVERTAIPACLVPARLARLDARISLDVVPVPSWVARRGTPVTGVAGVDQCPVCA